MVIVYLCTKILNLANRYLFTATLAWILCMFEGNNVLTVGKTNTASMKSFYI